MTEVAGAEAMGQDTYTWRIFDGAEKVTVGWRVGAGAWRLKAFTTRLGRPFFAFRKEKGYVFQDRAHAERHATTLGGRVIRVVRKAPPAPPPPPTPMRPFVWAIQELVSPFNWRDVYTRPASFDTALQCAKDRAIATGRSHRVVAYP